MILLMVIPYVFVGRNSRFLVLERIRGGDLSPPRRLEGWIGVFTGVGQGINRGELASAVRIELSELGRVTVVVVELLEEVALSL